MELPDSCMSRISVSMGVLPTSLMKKSWEMRLAGTARRAGRRSSKRPKRWGWLGYCNLSYSVRATWAFSCRDSTWAGSVRPHASVEEKKTHRIIFLIFLFLHVFLFYTSLLHSYANLSRKFMLYIHFGPFMEYFEIVGKYALVFLLRARWKFYICQINMKLQLAAG